MLSCAILANDVENILPITLVVIAVGGHLHFAERGGRGIERIVAEVQGAGVDVGGNGEIGAEMIGQLITRILTLMQLLLNQ
jgi:hypothetical protein